MEAVDTTVINTAIPVMAQSLMVKPIDLKIALISYLLSLAIFIPISGWVADKFGAKQIFMCAVVVFTLSSIWCGFTQSLMELVAARILQGLGGSLTLPVGRLIIVRTCERHELISKMNIVVMVAALGMMLGPVIGGYITHYFSWRWIFWVNIPIGIMALLLSIRLLPHMPPTQVPPLDKLGFILFGSGLATLTYGLSALSESQAGLFGSITTLLIACLLLFLYTKHSKHKPHPIIRVELLQIRTFKISVTGNIAARLGFSGLPFLLPLLLQIDLGYSPQLSGVLLAPTALGVMIVKPFSLTILRHLGYKRVLILNTVLVGICLWSFILVDHTTSLYFIGLLTFIFGFLIALQYTSMNSLAYANLVPEQISSATSIMSTIQQLSQTFGVAVAAILIRVFSGFNGLSLTLNIFHETFFTMGLLTFCSLSIFLTLNKEDGHELIDVNPQRM